MHFTFEKSCLFAHSLAAFSHPEEILSWASAQATVWPEKEMIHGTAGDAHTMRLS